MPFLVAAVVLVGLLALLNLILTAAVIRRLREHSARLADPSPGLDFLPVGSTLPAFSGVSVRGETVSTEPDVVAFLSTTCDVCHEQLPALVRYLRERGVARDAALVVVVGKADDPDGGTLVAALDPVATVLREPFDGPVGHAFGARAFPTFYRVEDGVVRAVTLSVDQLAPDPVRT